MTTKPRFAVGERVEVLDLPVHAAEAERAAHALGGRQGVVEAERAEQLRHAQAELLGDGLALEVVVLPRLHAGRGEDREQFLGARAQQGLEGVHGAPLSRSR